MIGRRLPASSSFVLAAARLRALQLDPGRATAQTGSHEEKPQHSPPQTPAAKAQVTGSDHHTLLTAKAPMGAQMVPCDRYSIAAAGRWRAPSEVSGADSTMPSPPVAEWLPN